MRGSTVVFLLHDCCQSTSQGQGFYIQKLQMIDVFPDAPANARPNVFSKILQPSKNCTDPSALQMELHFRSTKESTRFTVLLNNMRLMGVFDWLLALRTFIMVEVPNPFENGENCFIAYCGLLTKTARGGSASIHKVIQWEQSMTVCK